MEWRIEAQQGLEKYADAGARRQRKRAGARAWRGPSPDEAEARHHRGGGRRGRLRGEQAEDEGVGGKVRRNLQWGKKKKENKRRRLSTDGGVRRSTALASHRSGGLATRSRADAKAAPVLRAAQGERQATACAFLRLSPRARARACARASGGWAKVSVAHLRR